MEEQVNAARESLTEPVLVAADALRQQWEENLPPNWRELSREEVTTALEVTARSGPCVVWAPRAEFVRELVRCDSHQSREGLLLKRRDEILLDISEVLDDASASTLAEQAEARTAARASVAAARADHYMAAQALVAAGLGRLLHRVLEHDRLGRTYKELSAQDPKGAVLRLMRLTHLELATANALTDTERQPEGFNRHGTVHGDPRFYSPADLVAGLLLLGAWIRELSWWAEHHPSAFNGKQGGR